MCYILNIETATTVCSVSLSKNGSLLFYKELNNGFTHAENLHVFIEALLKESRITPKQLCAIAVSKGPGSYTGLRIGVSAAKGLAYALQLPLISIDTLQLIALQAKTLQKENDFYCPMLDARRMEVYTAVYDNELIQQLPIEALIVDATSIQKFTAFSNILFFGDGMHKCKETLQVLKNARFIENITPSAKDMCKLAYDKFITKQVENVAYFEPFYLKDFLILKKKV